MKASTEELRRAYTTRFDCKYPLVVSLNPTPEEQTRDIPKRMSDLDAAALEDVVRRVNEGVPETPRRAPFPADDWGPEDAGCKRERVDINTKLEAVARQGSSQVFNFMGSRARRSGSFPVCANLPPEAASVPFAYHSAGQRFHLDYNMDYALKMKKMAEAATAAKQRRDQQTEVKPVGESGYNAMENSSAAVLPKVDSKQMVESITASTDLASTEVAQNDTAQTVMGRKTTLEAATELVNTDGVATQHGDGVSSLSGTDP